MPDSKVEIPREQFHDITHDVRDALHTFVCKGELGELNKDDVRDLMQVVYTYRDKVYNSGYEMGYNVGKSVGIKIEKESQTVREFINDQPYQTD